jgi:hypothetical protein
MVDLVLSILFFLGGWARYQASGDLAADFPDISPGELPGNPTGRGAGEYCQHKHQQAPWVIMRAP